MARGSTVKLVTAWEPNPGPQAEFVNSREFEVFYGGSRGGGKGQPYDAEIITPFGIARIGDMGCGSQVCCQDGTVARVIGVYPQGRRPVFKITMDDGASTEADDSHLWLYRLSEHTLKAKRRSIYGNQLRWRMATTPQIESFVSAGLKVRMPLTEPAAMTTARRYKCGLDPYVLGLLIGDGCFSGKSLQFASGDAELISAVSSSLDLKLSNGCNYRSVGESRIEYKAALKRVGLLGCHSNTKFVPHEYLYGPPYVRLAILQGLLDTDGYIDDRGHIQFVSVSNQLALDVQFLVRSLGGKATLTQKVGAYKNKEGERIECQVAYMLYIRLPKPSDGFRLLRKKERYEKEGWNGGHELTRRVESVEPVGEKETVCVKIDHPSGLYLTNDFIVTHNTDALIAYMTVYMKNPNYCGLLLRRTNPQLLQVRTRCKRLYQLIDPGCHFSKEDNVFEMSTGSTVQLGHVYLDEDVERYQGQEYQIIAFEELTQFKQVHYDTIKLSCRSSHADMIPMVRATGNPRGIGHSWVRKRFIDIGPPGTVAVDRMVDGRELTRKFIKATVYDNPILMANDPQYLAILQGIQDPKLRAAMLDGDWFAAEGMYFNEFETDIHTRPLHSMFPHGRPVDGQPVFATLDWGFSKPFAVYWHTIDRYDKLVTFKEWYGIKYDEIKGEFIYDVGLRMPAGDVAAGIARRSEGLNVEFLVSDPSIRQQHGVSAKNQGAPGSILGEMLPVLDKAGIPIILGNNDRKAGWQQMKSRLSTAPDGNPWWIITDNCTHLVRTIQSAPEDPDDFDDVDTDAEDHPLDSCRYGCMQFPLELEKSMRAFGTEARFESFRAQMSAGRSRSGRPIACTYH